MTILLIIIYIAFIGLGLSDSLLGSAWPVMHRQLDVPVSYAGIVSMTISAGTVTSSLLSDRLSKKFGTRFVVILSVCLSAAALFGFSISGSFFLLWLCAFPYGLGAGSLDATLNNYVAVNYKSRHMNWLHCFWGAGAMIGPYIMGLYLIRGFEWTVGYRTIVVFQVLVVVMLLGSLALWKKPGSEENTNTYVKPFSDLFKIKGVKYVLLAFFAYCAIEATTMLWASTFMVSHRGISAEVAAGFASLFFLGITGGRFLSGIISGKLGNTKMVKMGISLIFIGIIAIWLPTDIDLFSYVGLITIGLGCAPIFPSIIHSTPKNFGYENSQALVGLQMASAYTGSALIPPLFGLIASLVGMSIFPIFIFVFAILLFVMTTALNRVIRNKL